MIRLLAAILLAGTLAVQVTRWTPPRGREWEFGGSGTTQLISGRGAFVAAGGADSRDWPHEIRVDEDGYPICAGTPRAARDLADRKGRAYQALQRELMEQAP